MTLRDEHLFSITSLPDQIALLAVFMPTLRSCADAYVKTWNRHKIRKQPKHPWAVTGKPIFNYQHSIKPDLKQAADPTLLQVLQEDLAGWDADEYLPHETLVWCTQQLQQIGFNPCERFYTRSQAIHQSFGSASGLLKGIERISRKWLNASGFIRVASCE